MFVFRFHRGFGEMLYRSEDLERLWQLVMRRMKRNPRFLIQVRADYLRRLRRYRPFIRRIETENFAAWSDDIVLLALQTAVRYAADTVGIGHIIESISLPGERYVQEALRPLVPPGIGVQELMGRYIRPNKPSYIQREEEELRRISSMSGEQQQRALQRHAKRYAWLRANYAEPTIATVSFFRRRMQTLPARKKNRRSNKRLPALPPAVRQLTSLMSWTMGWQDERKQDNQHGIMILGMVLAEVHRRLKIPKPYLFSLTRTDIESASTLQAFRTLLPELRRRQQGCLILQERGRETVLSGASYRWARLPYQQAVANEAKEIRGTVANRGQAQGRVRVCRTLRDIQGVKPGEVLVASMTRPEYLTAMKKAVAIITDEGGITSHAAIISRELDIPCIIGTKVATKMLKNGDCVDVDAFQGIVNIISAGKP